VRPFLGFAAAGLWATATLVAAETGGKPAAVFVDAKVARVCQNCHGQTGDSVSPIYPSITVAYCVDF
jgi:cytochrome c553